MKAMSDELGDFRLLCFKSGIVWLKAILDNITLSISAGFQFHNGTIKRSNDW